MTLRSIQHRELELSKNPHAFLNFQNKLAMNNEETSKRHSQEDQPNPQKGAICLKERFI
jgi:hypothetical protein